MMTMRFASPLLFVLAASLSAGAQNVTLQVNSYTASGTLEGSDGSSFDVSIVGIETLKIDAESGEIISGSMTTVIVAFGETYVLTDDDVSVEPNGARYYHFGTTLRDGNQVTVGFGADHPIDIVDRWFVTLVEGSSGAFGFGEILVD